MSSPSQEPGHLLFTKKGEQHLDNETSSQSRLQHGQANHTRALLQPQSLLYTHAHTRNAHTSASSSAVFMAPEVLKKAAISHEVACIYGPPATVLPSHMNKDAQFWMDPLPLSSAALHSLWPCGAEAALPLENPLDPGQQPMIGQTVAGPTFAVYLECRKAEGQTRKETL